MEDYQEKSGEVIFNLAVDQNRHIGKLLEKVTIQYLDGDTINSYLTLMQIGQIISSKLNIKQIELLKRGEQIVNKCIATKSSKLLGSVELYQKIIMRLLDEKGFLNPLKEERSGLYGQKK